MERGAIITIIICALEILIVVAVVYYDCYSAHSRRKYERERLGEYWEEIELREGVAKDWNDAHKKRIKS